MVTVTVQLSAEDHRLLRLYCLSTGKSQDAAVAELLRAELDRALPGKREAAEETQPADLWEALGTERPAPGPEARRWSAEVIDSLRDGTELSDVRPAA